MTGEVVALVSAVLVFVGALLALCATVGLVRFRDTLSRMHPAAKPQTLGLVLVLSGAVLRTWGLPGVGILVLAALCAFATAPVVANRVGELAIRESPDATVDQTPVDIDVDGTADREGIDARDRRNLD